MVILLQQNILFFNTGSGKLPFTIGGHPAFNCPLCDDEEFEDYFVKFDKVLTKSA